MYWTTIRRLVQNTPTGHQCCQRSPWTKVAMDSTKRSETCTFCTRSPLQLISSYNAVICYDANGRRHFMAFQYISCGICFKWWPQELQRCDKCGISTKLLNDAKRLGRTKGRRRSIVIAKLNRSQITQLLLQPRCESLVFLPKAGMTPWVHC